MAGGVGVRWTVTGLLVALLAPAAVVGVASNTQPPDHYESNLAFLLPMLAERGGIDPSDEDLVTFTQWMAARWRHVDLQAAPSSGEPEHLTPPLETGYEYMDVGDVFVLDYDTRLLPSLTSGLCPTFYPVGTVGVPNVVEGFHRSEHYMITTGFLGWTATWGRHDNFKAYGTACFMGGHLWWFWMTGVFLHNGT
jgi:hypothetical protein